MLLRDGTWMFHQLGSVHVGPALLVGIFLLENVIHNSESRDCFEGRFDRAMFCGKQIHRSPNTTTIQNQSLGLLLSIGGLSRPFPLRPCLDVGISYIHIYIYIYIFITQGQTVTPGGIPQQPLVLFNLTVLGPAFMLSFLLVECEIKINALAFFF